MLARNGRRPCDFFLAGERLKALTNNFTRKDWFVGLSKMTLLPGESASFMKHFRRSPVFITVENEKTKSRWHLYAPDKIWKNLGGVVGTWIAELVDKNAIIVKHGKSCNHLTKTLFSKRGTFCLRRGTTCESLHKHLDNNQTIKECQLAGCPKRRAKSVKHYET